jgi:hypothetical protein
VEIRKSSIARITRSRRSRDRAVRPGVAEKG